MCGCNVKLSLGPAACLKPWHREEVGLQVELVLNLSASCSVGMNVLLSRKKKKKKKKKNLSTET